MSTVTDGVVATLDAALRETEQQYEQVEPGQVPQRYNPVATYRRTFELEHPLEPG